MNFKEIKELIEILDQSNLTEINIEDNKGSVVNLKKEKETEIITPQVAQQPAPSVAQPQVAQPQVAQSAPQVSEDTQSQEVVTDNYETINAPMVGTFYKSPSPEEGAYVQVGDKVSNDTTVCILEAMKLFNEIQAEISGEIVEILVEDGQMVEYGQPLFKVK
ncbi:acetyl-CoA carboxylase biotin carboxyl carrier protein [Staphylococcus warneri]|uniref:acetyl-CoA carboxylase biotin carboxyl carrier protein n=1 Tax=Staphylococcus warneri TaxID=1292 RepID=UPI000F6E4FD3|nr:acetyl-CoA carboxylase biotin carboxyl carrier protein [Staphylococcus warneri]VED27854.1 putative acetyl-CoA carboxylase biotin carboxyl carrier subunit [Staphylococcus warneri]